MTHGAPCPVRARRCASSGFTLVELMIALVLGLALVGAGLSVLLGQLETQRRQVIASRVQQELRHALDLMLRDLRRSGHWHDAPVGLSSSGPGGAANPYADLLPAQGTSSSLFYSYDRQRATAAVQTNERYGWRIHPTAGTLDMRLSGPALAPGEGDAWQAVTDPGAVRLRVLSVRTERLPVEGAERCARPCPVGASNCPPSAWLRRVTVELEGSATGDPGLVRHLGGSALLRTLQLQGRCP